MLVEKIAGFLNSRLAGIVVLRILAEPSDHFIADGRPASIACATLAEWSLILFGHTRMAWEVSDVDKPLRYDARKIGVESPSVFMGVPMETTMDKATERP